MAGIYTVSQITAYIKNIFAKDYILGNITVSGEISNCKYHSAGHIYFTLKDSGAQINCVMFASQRSRLSVKLKDGQQAEVKGRIAVYEKSGGYQLYASDINLKGQGELFERFLKLKLKLSEMGMFDEMYKKPIPKYSLTIGIVTAPTGAAIKDIINVSTRRNPYLSLILCPAKVQGNGAAESIAKAIKRLDSLEPDVMIVGRGGGSIEDLWAFNEEIVARAIFEAKTPIISAVGHETDFTIADFAADLRAPTPSAAAEIASFEFDAFEEELAAFAGTMESIISRRINLLKTRLEADFEKLKRYSPEGVLEAKKQRISEIKKSMGRALMLSLERAENEKNRYYSSLKDITDKKFTSYKRKYELTAARLDGASPLKKISGGYGYLMSKGSSIKSIGQVNTGDEFKAYITDGIITGRITGTEEMYYDR